MIDLDKYFKIAEEINSQVSEFLLAKFGSKKESTHKSDSHYGIAEDVESNSLYENFLKVKTPEVALYTEEGERNIEHDLVWVIDPIEGTSNYSAGNPFWATQIALLYNNEPVVSIVNAPVLKQKFSATKGGGAFLNGTKITPSSLVSLNRSLLEMGRGTTDTDKEWFSTILEKVIKNVRTVRVFGSTGLGICYAACGITDIYLNSGSQIYDYVPGYLIAKEAGQNILSLNGENWKVDSDGLVVANNNLTTEIFKITK